MLKYFHMWVSSLAAFETDYADFTTSIGEFLDLVVTLFGRCPYFCRFVPWDGVV